MGIMGTGTIQVFLMDLIPIPLSIKPVPAVAGLD